MGVNLIIGVYDTDNKTTLPIDTNDEIQTASSLNYLFITEKIQLYKSK